MKRYNFNIFLISLLSFAGILSACSNDIEDFLTPNQEGQANRTTYLEFEIEDLYDPNDTRSVPGPDGWAAEVFSVGDKAGLYARKGGENPADKNDFSMPIRNKELIYAGGSGKVVRFNTADGSTIDQDSIYAGYFAFYTPYDANMTDPAEPAEVPGPIARIVDPKDNIEKLIDYHYGSKSTSNGVTTTIYYRNGSLLVFQRGEGFQNPKDPRIWVVLRKPFSDIRITETSPTSSFTYSGSSVFKNNIGALDPDPMITLPTGNEANKYATLQAWEGQDFKNIPSYYCYVPGSFEVFYIVAQDDNGTWQNITDFYLDSSYNKTPWSNYRYIITLKRVGVNVVARPVSIENWGDETFVTDDRKMGISDFKEYNDWAAEYNAYIQDGRSSSHDKNLMKYGEAVHNTATGKTDWTFYINAHIRFEKEFIQVARLEDKLICTSTYDHFKMYNIQAPLIKELVAGGQLKEIDFPNVYLIQDESATNSFGAVAEKMSGGEILSCNITNSIVISHNYAGMMVGDLSGGTIKGCIVSGDVIGKGTSTMGNGLFGTYSGNPSYSDNNTSGLQFIKN